MWLRLEDQELALIDAALRSARGDQPEDPDAIALADRIAAKIAEGKEPWRADYINAVETDDELEVDDDAIVSEGGDPGAWVMAWVWITDAQAGHEEEDEDDDE